jgi:hypothetical protein
MPHTVYVNICRFPLCLPGGTARCDYPTLETSAILAAAEVNSNKTSQILSFTHTHLSHPSASKLYNISEPTSFTRHHHTKSRKMAGQEQSTKQAIEMHCLQQSNTQPAKSRRTYHLQSCSRDTRNATYHNAAESPLLLLPAELRERIWTIAFGNRTIHPWVVQPRPKQAKLSTISFMDHEIYAYKLDEQSAMKDLRWKEACRQAKATRTYVGSHKYCPDVIEDPTQPLYMDNISFIVPLVCT